MSVCLPPVGTRVMMGLWHGIDGLFVSDAGFDSSYNIIWLLGMLVENFGSYSAFCSLIRQI